MSDIWLPAAMEALFGEARANGLWFFGHYQQLWWSPDELESQQRNGNFRWGPRNFKLRDPAEREMQLVKELAEKQEELRRFRERVCQSPRRIPMNETKWTPGPWEANYGGGITGPRAAPSSYFDDETNVFQIPIRTQKLWAKGPAHHVVAWVLESGEPSDEYLEPSEQMKADASLIAAAPELYEALSELLGKHPGGDNQEEKIAARAALAKARGESQ